MPTINSGYTLTAYFNTGFNGVDIPADASVLSNATKRVYTDNYFLREDVDKPVIRVNDNYFNLRDCDYVKLEPKTGNTGGVTCYYFCVPSALAHNTTLLALELDALLTMGGAKNLDYISGWQERGHIAKTDDTLFDNVAPEEFVPSKPLKTRGGEKKLAMTGTASDDLSLVVSTVLLCDVANGSEVDVITGVDGLGDEKMYFPQIKVNPFKTEFTELVEWDYTGQTWVGRSEAYTLPSTVAYLYDQQKVKDGLKALYSAGQLSLMAAYVIPKEYLTDVWRRNIPTLAGSSGTAVQQIHCADEIIRVNDSDFQLDFAISGYTVKNKKVYSMYNQYQLANIASGGMSIKDAYLLYDGTYNIPMINIWGDPSPTGKPLARFRYIADCENLFADVVSGATWYQQQLVYEGASGSLWNSINAAFANANLNRQKAENNLLSQYTQAQYNRDTAKLDYNSMYAEKSLAVNTAFGVGAGIAGAIGDVASENYGMAARAGVGVARELVNSAMQAGNIASQWAFSQADLDAKRAYDSATQGLQRANILQQINENKIGLLKNNTIVAPTVLFTPSDTLSLYNQNRFVLYHVTMDDEDIKELDMYFQRYGYNGIHRPLTAQCFNERQYFNYVQAFDVNIRSNFGMRIRQKAISQLNGGVRVWKVLPNATYYETN